MNVSLGSNFGIISELRALQFVKIVCRKQYILLRFNNVHLYLNQSNKIKNFPRIINDALDTPLAGLVQLVAQFILWRNQLLCNVIVRFVLSVCLWFFVPPENFSTYGDVTIVGEGLQMLTYARQSCSLTSERFFLTCHTYSDYLGNLSYIDLTSIGYCPISERKSVGYRPISISKGVLTSDTREPRTIPKRYLQDGRWEEGDRPRHQKILSPCYQ